jgi:hypothetical protein
MFNAAVAAWLRDYAEIDDVVGVTSVEQDSKTFGVCDTCSYTEVTVNVGYITTEGAGKTYEYRGDLASMVRQLAGI